MARQPKLTTDERIQDMEYNLAKLKFVKGIFPDVKVTSYKGRNGLDYLYFSSKLVNAAFNKYEFLGDNRYSIGIRVCFEAEFNFNDKVEIIKIESSPKICSLVRRETPWDRTTYRAGQPIIKFSRFSFNMKKNNFRSEDILKECQAKVMEFIKVNSDAKIDDKHLDSRLKKLLVFS